MFIVLKFAYQNNVKFIHSMMQVFIHGLFSLIDLELNYHQTVNKLYLINDNFQNIDIMLF
jgi:hypothetical protein